VAREVDPGKLAGDNHGWEIERTVTQSTRTAPHAAAGLSGRIAVPGSKSLTQRGLAAAAAAGGGSRVVAPLDAEDPRLLFEGLRAAGFELRWEDGEIVAAGRREVAAGECSLGNNGTGVRFLIALLAALPGEWRVDGSPRLRERPVAPLVQALRTLGAEIRGEGEEDRLPLVIRGAAILGGEVVVDASVSSQFVSALLLLGARLPRGLVVRLPAPPPSRPYLDLTADVLAEFGSGVAADRDGTRYEVAGGALRPSSYVVEGDWSAAAFPLCGAAVAGGRVEVAGVRRESRQGDAVVLDILARAGCEVASSPAGVALRGPASGRVEADLRNAPDLFPALAVLAARCGGRLEGLAALRVKESDRLAVMTAHLSRLGLPVHCGDDWFEAAGGDGRRSAEPFDPAADHRIAMALAVAGSFIDGVTVANPGCVAKSWPTFWRDWSAVTGPGP